MYLACHETTLFPARFDRYSFFWMCGHLANNLDEFGPIEVQDITFGTEVTAEGLVHDFTVYFRPLADSDDGRAES